MSEAIDRSPVALDDLKFDDRGLIPVSRRTPTTAQVLMMAWANREALERTLAEGRMVYWSRSRQELWRKGDTSGHVQHWKELRVDCDGDVLLARVHQEGAACHTGERSCFFRTLAKTAAMTTVLRRSIARTGRQLGSSSFADGLRAAGDTGPRARASTTGARSRTSTRVSPTPRRSDLGEIIRRGSAVGRGAPRRHRRTRASHRRRAAPPRRSTHETTGCGRARSPSHSVYRLTEFGVALAGGTCRCQIHVMRRRRHGPRRIGPSLEAVCRRRRERGTVPSNRGFGTPVRASTSRPTTTSPRRRCCMEPHACRLTWSGSEPAWVDHDHAEAGHPQGLPGGADPAAVRGGGPARAPWLRAATTTARSTTTASSASACCARRRSRSTCRTGSSTSASPARTGSPRRGSDVEVLTSLTYAKSGTGHGTKIVLAVPNEHPANTAAEMPPGSRISTEFVRLTERHFATSASR